MQLRIDDAQRIQVMFPADRMMILFNWEIVIQDTKMHPLQTSQAIGILQYCESLARASLFNDHPIFRQADNEGISFKRTIGEPKNSCRLGMHTQIGFVELSIKEIKKGMGKGVQAGLFIFYRIKIKVCILGGDVYRIVVSAGRIPDGRMAGPMTAGQQKEKEINSPFLFVVYAMQS